MPGYCLSSRDDLCDPTLSTDSFRRLLKNRLLSACATCRGLRQIRDTALIYYIQIHDLHTYVRGRVNYKIAILCYKAVKLQQPSYLTYRQSRVPRSSTSDLLSTESSLTNIAARRFSCCAPPFGTVFLHLWGYRGGSPTAVQAWQPCPLWELSPSHPILL